MARDFLRDVECVRLATNFFGVNKALCTFSILNDAMLLRLTHWDPFKAHFEPKLMVKVSPKRSRAPKSGDILQNRVQNRDRGPKSGESGASPSWPPDPIWTRCCKSEPDFDSKCSQNRSRAPKSGESLLNHVQNRVRGPKSGEPGASPILAP